MKLLKTIPQRNRTKRQLLLSVAALVAVLVMATSLEAQNGVTDWDGIALNTIVAVGKKNPQAASMYFAYVSAAMYDAVNSIDGSHTPLFTKSAVPNSTSKDAAAASAAHDVLTHYFPLQQAPLTPHWPLRSVLSRTALIRTRGSSSEGLSRQNSLRDVQVMASKRTLLTSRATVQESGSLLRLLSLRRWRPGWRK